MPGAAWFLLDSASGCGCTDLKHHSGALRSVFEAELSDHIPVIKSPVAGTRLTGRMTCGMGLPFRRLDLFVPCRVDATNL